MPSILPAVGGNSHQPWVMSPAGAPAVGSLATERFAAKCSNIFGLFEYIYIHCIHSYTFIYKFNILFTFIFFAAKRSVAKLPTAGAPAGDITHGWCMPLATFNVLYGTSMFHTALECQSASYTCILASYTRIYKPLQLVNMCHAHAPA